MALNLVSFAFFFANNTSTLHVVHYRSFGDYFKEDAIKYAWELLTEVYSLDPDRIYATYFQGNEEIEADLEARDYWLQYLPQERVIGCDAKDNFWEVCVFMN